MTKKKNDLLLEADALNISYKVEGKWIRAVSEFCMELKAGQIYGLVGESGSGKSTIAQALMRYLSANGRIDAGSTLNFLGQDMTSMSRSQMRQLWTQKIKLVPQNAGAALNPSIKIGQQMTEIVEHALGLQGQIAYDKVIEMFTAVQLVDPEKVFDRYAHELSGGMQQRVVIAMALITDPELLIMDEPTTGLDVTTEAVILDLVRKLIADRDTGVVYITHNLGVVAQLCERVLVLYAGEVMEDAPVNKVYQQPLHPYTMGLLNSIPRPGMTKRDSLLQSISGSPPSLKESRHACAFVARCPFVIDKCREVKPPLERINDHHTVRCHRWQDVQAGGLIYDTEGALTVSHDLDESSETIMRVDEITKHFPVTRTLQDVINGEQPAPIRAVDGVNISIRQGHTLGLVGESGSGKTTLSRVIIGLQERTAGKIELLGMDIRNTVRDRSEDVLAKIQMVFQNPQNSLNPYLSVRQTIRRPLMKLRGLSRQEADKEVLQLLRDVNLREEYANRFPNELSGGEKQRVVIARAFASDPDLIICDEPVSALDVSVQSAVLNLLARLQDENGTSYLFISHDLAVVGYLADYLAVMYLGQLFEVGSAKELFNPPYHPYTEALVSAIPVPSPEIKENRVLLNNSVPSAQNVPSGCRFHTRCPRKLGAICEEEVPPWLEHGDGHFIRCHIPIVDLLDAQQSLVNNPETEGA
ncbi:MAG: ABC transporter ATP-binding protein [Chloroflexota bacterium]